MSGGGRRGAAPGGEEAEVDALLQAAQDAVMLKLQANSHLVSSSTAAASAPPPVDDAAAALDPLDADLARRFDALRSRAPPPKPAGDGMGELEARFAKLKGSGAAAPGKEARVRLEDLGGDSSEDEEEEVDKLMRWAMDAARLDAATAGGGERKRREAEEEEEKGEKSSASSEEEEDEEERLELEMARKRKEMAKSKSKNKWFFF